MSQRRKNKTDTSVERKTGLQTTRRNRGSRRTTFVIASVVIAVILVIVGIFYYFREDARYNRLAVITVDDTSIKMEYFLRRTKLANIDPINMLQQLTIEQIIKLKAPDFVGEPAPQDIDTALRYIAAGSNSSDDTENAAADLTDSQFKEWYRQELKATGLSDAEYKDVIRTNMLADVFQQYLAERVPTVAEQVHLNVIELKTYDDADKARERIEAGESFAAVAQEVSLDTESKENGGDIGWVPHGMSIFDSQIFSLPIDDISEPVPYYSQTGSTTPDSSNPNATPDAYFLLMVSEKASSREIDENNLGILKDQVLYNWLSTEVPSHNIEYNFDSEIQAWVNLQLAKMPTPTLTPAPTSTTTPAPAG